MGERPGDLAGASWTARRPRASSATPWRARDAGSSAARERALLYSRRGRLLVTYRDLRPGRETPIAVAAAGRDLLLGSPGANRAYVVAG